MNIYSWAKNNFKHDSDCIIITGATSGIGYEYLKLISNIRSTIYIVSEENEKLEEIAKELTNSTVATVIPITCDFSSPTDVKNFINNIKNLNVKILINNAGIGMKGLFRSHTSEEIDRIYNINTITPLKILLAVIPNMLKHNSGVVIQVTTVNVVTPIPLNSLYTGGKTGLSSTFSAVMFEHKNTNIIFHEMRPGTTETPFHEKQGVIPKAMLMSAKEVASRSLNNIDKKIFHPNRADRVLVKLGGHLPLFTKMHVGLFFLKKRLGIE